VERHAGALGMAPAQSASLSVVGHVDGTCHDLEVVGPVLYAACGPTMVALDLTNPAQLSVLGTYDAINEIRLL